MYNTVGFLLQTESFSVTNVGFTCGIEVLLPLLSKLATLLTCARNHSERERDKQVKTLPLCFSPLHFQWPNPNWRHTTQKTCRHSWWTGGRRGVISLPLPILKLPQLYTSGTIPPSLLPSPSPPSPSSPPNPCLYYQLPRVYNKECQCSALNV